MRAPKHAFLKQWCGCGCRCARVCVCVCVGLLACLTLRLLRLLYISGDQRRVCVQACLCVRLHNAEQPRLSPQTWKKKKKKKSQPGGHFEIPGAHLANPGNWGVYISATERGKRPDAPVSCSAASIQRSLTSPWVTDLCVCVCVCVCVGGVEVYRECWVKSLNTLWWLAAGRHDIMQQCWKLASLVSCVCLNSTIFCPRKPHAHTHTPLKHTLCFSSPLSLLTPYYLALLLCGFWIALLSSPIVDSLFANSSSASLSVKKTMGHEWEYV